MARQFGPVVPPNDPRLCEPWLNRELRRIGSAVQQNSAGLSAIARGEAPDASGSPLVDTGLFFVKPGLGGSQSAYGAVTPAGFLLLSSTASPTKGLIYLGSARSTVYDEVNDRIGITSTAPGAKLEIKQAAGTVANVPSSVQSGESQLSSAGWTNELGAGVPNLLNRIAKTTSDNSTYLQSTAIPGTTFVLFSAITAQPSTANIRVVFYGRWHGTSGAFSNTWWNFGLDSGGTNIWSSIVNSDFIAGLAGQTSDSGWVEMAHTLTAAEITAISNWSALKLSFSCSGGGSGYSAQFQLASVRFEIVGATSVDAIDVYDTAGALQSGMNAAGALFYKTSPGTGKLFTSDSAGVGSWTTPSLLSASHGDTLADTVIRGDLIVGNSTPKWARLPRGPAGQILEMVGSDPTWSSASGLATRIQHDWRANGPYRVDTSVDGAFVAPSAMTVSAVRIWRRLAGTSGQTTLDVNKNGVTMYTTQANRPKVLASAGDNATNSATLPDIVSIAAGDKITVDTDEIEGGRPRDWVLIIEGS